MSEGEDRTVVKRITRPDGSVEEKQYARVKPKREWHFSTVVQVIVGVIGITIFVSGLVVAVATAWGDDRYVLKGELKQGLENVVTAVEDAALNRELQYLEESILTLEDEILWENGQSNFDLARKNCRALVRKVREWEAITKDDWTADPIAERVCRR